MENIGGALSFKATLDIDDFKVSSEAMARHIKNASDNAVLEANRMEQSFLTFAQNGARYIVSYLVGQGMMSLVQSIVQVRGQFQQLELAFNTMLRSTEKQQVLMSQLVDTAAKTTFDLTSIAQGAKQMLAFGSNVESVVDEIVMLGNVASGVSAPLGDLIYLYGTLRSQGRAYTVDIRQFAGRGIPIYEELGKVLNADRQELNKLVTEGKVGFPEVEKAFKNMTSEGGIYFNLMQEQSKSLTGMISNLGDAWDSALNKLGKENQDLFAGAIQGAIGLVENMDEIIRIIEAVTIAYGSYKAAIVLNTLATKGYTGVAMIDNTVKQAKIALLKAEASITGQTAAQTKAMIAVEQAHVSALQNELTAEEQANLVKKLRIATIQQLLTAQQQEYLSNLNLTTSSANYEAVATTVLTVEQREALSKLDLSSKSAVYRAALEQEVAAKKRNNAATLEAMRADVKAAAQKVESAKQTAVSAMQATEMARYELYWARQAGNATKITTAEKKLEAAQDNQSAARKAALAAQTDLYTKRKQLETAAIQQSRIASSVDTAAKAAQATTTNVLTLATNKLTASFKALWLSMKANPITWVVSLVGMAFSAISMLSSKTKELEEDTVSLANSTKRATERFSEEAGKVEALEKIIRNSNVAYDERNKALNELKQIIPGYNAELTKEGTIINDNADAIQRYLGLLEKQIRLKAAQEELEAAYREKRLKEKEIIQKQAAYDEASANVPDVAYGDAGAQYQMYALRQAGKAERQLKQAQKELTDINKTIETLNQEISDTSGEIDKSSESAKTYSEQIADTRTQIATLTKELEDLRSGKVVKDNLAGEIDTKIKELNTAKKNLELLTGITSSGNGSSSANQLSQKELEAQRELEEARISIMEDGYEKRKAILDLQHKENLDRIDKEERELEEARKAAGKGGLTATEKDGFDERRSIENTSYQKQQNKLFDGEISYKKQQYELYFRWVRNMGEDVANTQFANLLKGGASFKQYLENQIAEMNQKKEAGTLTEGEGNHLISLNMQYDEITGAKSAMDLFKESVTEAISQATTLAEKVQAIADAKERLANGSTGLVGADEQAEASLFVSDKQAEADKEIQNRILNDFRSYEEKKNDILADYNAIRLSQIVQSNEELLSRINQGEANALSSLNAEQLKASKDWQDLFTNLDVLSSSEISKLIEKIEKQIANGDLKLNPVDYQALMDSLNEAKNKIVELNPFKALGSAFDNYIDATRKLKNAEKENLSPDQVNVLQKAVQTAADQMVKSIEEINQLLTSVGSSFSSLASSFGNDGLADTISGVTDVLGGAGQTAMGVGKIMSGDLLGGITGVIGGITGVIGAFNKMHDKKNEKRIQTMQDQVDDLADAYDNLGDSIARAYSTDKASMLEEQNKNLEKTNELIRKQIQEEKDKKDTDWDRIKEWEDQIAENEKQIAENTKYNIIEAIMGADISSAIDDFASAYADAWTAGEKAAGKSANVVKNLIKTAIIDQLKNKLKPEVEKFMSYLADAMEDGILTEAEERLLSYYEDRLESISDDYLSQNEKWLRDEVSKEESEDPLTGAVRSMSEETGGVIAGRLNAIVINQSSIDENIRQSLIYQAEIAANTKYCKRLDDIAESLRRIEIKDNSLLSQGIS